MNKDPFFEGIRIGNYVAVKKMLSSGHYSPNVQNADKMTPLHLVLSRSAMPPHDPRIEQILRLLIKSGADPSLRDRNGWTPLHFAAQFASFSNSLYLVKQPKVDVTELNKDGTTALHYLSRRTVSDEREKITYLLLLEQMIKKGADVNAETYIGETPLHQAALKGNVISGAFLVAAGSDLHFITRQGDTPLHYALMSGQEKMVEFLLSSGANCAVLPSLASYKAIGLVDTLFSILSQAKEKEEETYEEVVFSLEKGENFFGSSPTVVTVKYGEIVKIFKAPKKNLTENLVLWNEVLRFPYLPQVSTLLLYFTKIGQNTPYGHIIVSQFTPGSSQWFDIKRTIASKQKKERVKLQYYVEENFPSISPPNSPSMPFFQARCHSPPPLSPPLTPFKEGEKGEGGERKERGGGVSMGSQHRPRSTSQKLRSATQRSPRGSASTIGWSQGRAEMAGLGGKNLLKKAGSTVEQHQLQHHRQQDLGMSPPASLFGKHFPSPSSPPPSPPLSPLSPPTSPRSPHKTQKVVKLPPEKQSSFRVIPSNFVPRKAVSLSTISQIAKKPSQIFSNEEEKKDPEGEREKVEEREEGKGEEREDKEGAEEEVKYLQEGAGTGDINGEEGEKEDVEGDKGEEEDENEENGGEQEGGVEIGDVKVDKGEEEDKNKENAEKYPPEEQERGGNKEGKRSGGGDEIVTASQIRECLQEASRKTPLTYEINSEEVDFGEKIAEGSSGKVLRGLFRAQDVAIKVLKKTMVARQMKDFIDEFTILATLRSPFVVYFYGICVEPEMSLVMEYCCNGSVYGVLNRKDVLFDWNLFMRMATDMTRGLLALHSWVPQILHRDVKSLNYLVDANWVTKVSDFGLSRHQNKSNRATLGKVRGTFAYSAPEVYAGSPHTSKSDIYSLAIVLWELVHRICTGKYSIPYKEYTFIQFDFQILLQASNGLRPTIPENCPENIQNIISMCWDPDHERRPEARELLFVIQALQKEFKDETWQWNRCVKDLEDKMTQNSQDTHFPVVVDGSNGILIAQTSRNEEGEHVVTIQRGDESEKSEFQLNEDQGEIKKKRKETDSKKGKKLRQIRPSSMFGTMPKLKHGEKVQTIDEGEKEEEEREIIPSSPPSCPLSPTTTTRGSPTFVAQSSVPNLSLKKR